MLALFASDRRVTLGRRMVVFGLAMAAALSLPGGEARAARASEINRDGVAALNSLYASHIGARTLGAKARAILVFPSITKAGFMIGGRGGQGVLLVKGRAQGHYSIGAGSIGFQSGVQKFSYAMFFRTDKGLDYLANNDGWSIGSGPSVVLVDEGFAKSMNNTTLRKDVYSFAFGQKGLMAGLGLEGSKISRIHPKP